MKDGYWIILSGRGGELDRMFADTEEDALQCAKEILAGVANLCDGDSIRVTEGQCEV